MVIVGCDFHPGWQQVAVFDSGTGEIRELQLRNSDGEAERFYGSLPWPALVGFEACGNTHWFEDMLDRLGHEVWIGDAAEIRASYVRKQKTDKRDAAHILRLLMEGRFPRLWRPAQGGPRSAAVAHPSRSPGRCPHPGEERPASPDAEQGCATEAKAVEQNGAEDPARAAAGRMGCAAQDRSSAVAENAGPADRGTGCSRGTRCLRQ